MIAQSPNPDTIFKRHGIHPRFWAELRAFLEEHMRPGKELQACLDHVASYKAAEKRPCGNPSDHSVSAVRLPSPFPYESLLAEDIVISPGVPSAAR